MRMSAHHGCGGQDPRTGRVTGVRAPQRRNMQDYQYAAGTPQYLVLRGARPAYWARAGCAPPSEYCLSSGSPMETCEITSPQAKTGQMGNEGLFTPPYVCHTGRLWPEWHTPMIESPAHRWENFVPP